MTAIRVLHCPTTVGGNPQGLARAEREVGLQSWAVAFEQTYFAYPTDELLAGPHPSRWRTELERWRLLGRAMRDYDIVHYNFGQSMLPRREVVRPSSALQRLSRVYASLVHMGDLALLRRAGKGIVVTYQGDDARQGDYSLAHFEICAAREVEPGYYTPSSDQAKRQAIATFDRYADRIYYLNPDLGWVLPERARFMPYAHVDLREWHVVPFRVHPERLTVVHAPSHRGVKGTRYILDAVSRLQNEGISFEFLLVEGMSNLEARRLYLQADLLVDQLLAGWYGGVAVELMALGKPVICYLRESDLTFIPDEMRRELPIINATPATIYEVLRTALTSGRKELADIGRRGRVFVENWHDPLKIAAHLKCEYEAILHVREPKVCMSGGHR